MPLPLPLPLPLFSLSRQIRLLLLGPSICRLRVDHARHGLQSTTPVIRVAGVCRAGDFRRSCCLLPPVLPSPPHPTRILVKRQLRPKRTAAGRPEPCPRVTRARCNRGRDDSDGPGTAWTGVLYLSGKGSLMTRTGQLGKALITRTGTKSPRRLARATRTGALLIWSATGRRLRAAPAVGPPLLLAGPPLAAPTRKWLFSHSLRVLAAHGFIFRLSAEPGPTAAKGPATSRLRLSATRRFGASCLAPVLHAFQRWRIEFCCTSHGFAVAVCLI